MGRPLSCVWYGATSQGKRRDLPVQTQIPKTQILVPISQFPFPYFAHHAIIPHMLMSRVLGSNPALIDAAVELHQSGVIPANTWLYDLDTIAANARIQSAEAHRLGLTTFLMTKQVARNPLVAATALANGIDKTVAVDMTCAHLLSRYGIPVGHIGQINQIPRSQIGKALDLRPDYITVYSVESAGLISAEAVRQNLIQPLLLRVFGDHDVAFAGQEGGLHEFEAVAAARQIAGLPNVVLVGVTTFPVVEYTFERERMPPELLPNMDTIVSAARHIEQETGLSMTVINAPGNTSAETFAMLQEAGATHVEPGHGLCGTTLSQMMLGSRLERPAYVYVSEVSHHYRDMAYAFGGGLWSLLTGLFGGWTWEAAVGSTPTQAKSNMLDYTHIDQIIDYHLPLSPGDRCRIGDTVVFPMYTQAQMTRAYTAAVSGIASGRPVVAGLFDHAGTMLDDDLVPLPVAIAKSRVQVILNRDSQ